MRRRLFRPTEVRNLIASQVELKSAYDFEQAADEVGLSDGMRSLLRTPEKVLHSQIPVTLRDGRLENVDAWCVQHNTSRGPARGGVRYCPAVSLDELKAKAMLTSWRWAALDIPLGGGTAGAAAGLSHLSPSDAERLTHGALASVSPGTDWEAEAAVAEAGPKEDAAGRGVLYAVLAACEQIALALTGARVVVHGFGRTGSRAALLLARAGATVVGVSDTRGGTYCASGLDVSQVIRHKCRSGSVVGLRGTEHLADFELVTLDCEILVVSALEGSIRNRNAPSIRARMLVEAADDSITAKADAILDDKGVLVIPDMIANAGRDAVAYYETIREPDSHGRLQRDLRRALDELRAVSQERKVSLRRAAYIVGVSRVAEATRLRGTGSNADSQLEG
jgi:glutamate dehydrogenase (NAD(P)+)